MATGMLTNMLKKAKRPDVIAALEAELAKREEQPEVAAEPEETAPAANPTLEELAQSLSAKGASDDLVAAFMDTFNK